jgi:hypothetical protein
MMVLSSSSSPPMMKLGFLELCIRCLGFGKLGFFFFPSSSVQAMAMEVVRTVSRSSRFQVLEQEKKEGPICIRAIDRKAKAERSREREGEFSFHRSFFKKD